MHTPYRLHHTQDFFVSIIGKVLKCHINITYNTNTNTNINSNIWRVCYLHMNSYMFVCINLCEWISSYVRRKKKKKRNRKELRTFRCYLIFVVPLKVKRDNTWENNFKKNCITLHVILNPWSICQIFDNVTREWLYMEFRPAMRFHSSSTDKYCVIINNRISEKKNSKNKQRKCCLPPEYCYYKCTTSESNTEQPYAIYG